ncbi:PilZ domain-containing protein [Alkalihalobacillus sp. CinArs1]|uniref:PilZ domain-containing protein n=1 Tax=Alkalihalobacillus sp. CinArs1 TaxID=2995314 RepID=UPI0022DE67AE|nr:PilZ domain-containing protein [Alkalihalobacillus sp. CinArs1]
MNRDKRQVFRHQLSVPLAAKMRVLNGDEPDSKEFNHKIYIHDIGLEGIGFSSDPELAKHIDLEFELKLNEELFKVTGEILWLKANNPDDPNTRGNFSYGVKFYLKTEKQSSLVFQEVNRFAIHRHKRKKEIREMMREKLRKKGETR